MRAGRPKTPVVLSTEDRKQLNTIANSHSMPYGLVTRARIVLMAAEAHNNQIIAEKVSLSPQMVCKWRQRYIEQGITGLHDELRPGRPRSISDEDVAQVIHRTLKTKPKDSTHWSVRSLVKET